ncbi:hypothetical protein OF83DRAFT_305121 [Amylostereum chailletii]|nr:hypothetical protein OF83DRAFT_305121 [Amylostereum chailletii]
MALPMLVSGADCGPSNPLQGLTKTFDRDRGLQQDYFGAGRASSSRETFRTAQSSAPGLGQEAAQFFSTPNQISSPPPLAGHTSFDLAALRSTLPVPSNVAGRVLSRPDTQAAPLASWAADFLVQSPTVGVGSPQQAMSPRMEAPQEQMFQSSAQPMYQSQMPMYSMNQMRTFAPAIQLSAPQTQTSVHFDQHSLEQAFQSHEASVVTAAPIQEQPVTQKQLAAKVVDADELARTAGRLLDSVVHEQNPKFQNSQFLGLMRQLRDRTVTVEGNDMVEVDSSRSWSAEFTADVKGKGKAVDRGPTSFGQPAMQTAPQSRFGATDANEEYFHPALAQQSQQQQDWDRLQFDWDAFEANSVGVQPVTRYQFQTGNPYLLGERSVDTTRQHEMHAPGRSQSFFESVLQLEAAVQRDPTDAHAWFELGVKQQENEREQHALEALRRAVELDPSHLQSWLALAISSTNEGHRQGTFDAIREWITHNERYARPVGAHGGVGETFESMVECLIAMARSEEAQGLDADVQIALAILLNTTEDYEKANDCFKAALTARPDDWLLYNRVGATLANRGSAEQALPYYYRALELNPAYIRARFNLGISCINMGRYEEASQHILDALVLQDGDAVMGSEDARGATTVALWDSLKTCYQHLQRTDLASLCDDRKLDAIRAQLA